MLPLLVVADGCWFPTVEAIDHERAASYGETSYKQPNYLARRVTLLGVLGPAFQLASRSPNASVGPGRLRRRQRQVSWEP